MSEISNILNYISPHSSLVVNLDDYRRFLEIAKIEEQARIIKLLEELEAVGRDPATADYKPTDELIALIKGKTE